MRQNLRNFLFKKKYVKKISDSLSKQKFFTKRQEEIDLKAILLVKIFFVIKNLLS